MADMAVIVPSRGRPKAAAELAETCEKTCIANTWLIVAVDADDPTVPEYDTALAHHPHAIVHVVAEPGGHVGAINAGAADALRWKDPPFALAKLDDDHRPRTHGWDAAYLAALRELGTGIVYGNDLLQGANLPTAPGLTADIVRALGYMGLPALTHLYVDNWWKALGEAIGRFRYLPDVIVEHMHPLAGKAEPDDGYRRVNDRAQYLRDGAAYQDYLRTYEFADDVDKIHRLLVR